jgi:hypothetical protein
MVTPISREALSRGIIAGILPTTQPLNLTLSFKVHLPTYLPTYYTTRLLQHPKGLMTISLLEEDLPNDRSEKNSKNFDTFLHSNFLVGL